MCHTASEDRLLLALEQTVCNRLYAKQTDTETETQKKDNQSCVYTAMAVICAR
jgi:hypothetical protein